MPAGQRTSKGERLPIVSDFLEGKTTEVKNKSVTLKNATPALLADIKDITVHFPTRTNLFGKVLQNFTAVDGVNLQLYKGETLGLVGESGCGKTTLGRTLLRLIEPTSGQIIYNGTDLTRLNKQQVKELRKNVQLVFQDPYSSLNPRLTVGAAIAEPMGVAGIELNKQKTTYKSG